MADVRDLTLILAELMAAEGIEKLEVEREDYAYWLTRESPDPMSITAEIRRVTSQDPRTLVILFQGPVTWIQPNHEDGRKAAEALWERGARRKMHAEAHRREMVEAMSE